MLGVRIMDDPKLAPQQRKYLGPLVDERGFVPKIKIPLDRAESLAVMQQDFVFFTPAALYVKGGFTDAPLIDHMVEMGEDVPLYHYKFNRPLFKGLESRSGDKAWNHVLWAVPIPFWEAFSNFVASLTIADRDTNSVMRYGVQELEILDPVAVDKLTVLGVALPRVTVYAFHLYGSRFRAHFVSGNDLYLQPPALTCYLPNADMSVYAEAWFAGRNPIMARELFLSRQKQLAKEGPT